MLYKKLFIFLCLIFISNLVMANDSQRHKTVDGMSIYLGIIPAQLIRGHEKMHADGNNIKNKAHTYHVLIAIFDNNSKKRITDAKLKATVIPLGMKGKIKNLEPMRGDLLSYGNYFSMPELTLYQIIIEIQRKDKKVKSVVEFTFKHEFSIK